MVRPKRSLLTNLFGIDPRSLALLRILFAAILLVDLADRFGDFAAMYTEDGFLSLRDAQAYFAGTWRWSLYFLSDAAWFQASLFVVAACAAVWLLVGYHTRLATIVSWVMLASLHARNPLIINGGDELLACMLFWSIFLPLGRVWSLDALRRRQAGRQMYTPICSVATLAIMAQLCFMYLFAGVVKLNDDWLSGEALNYVFRCGAISKPLAESLLAYPGLLRFLTIGTLVLELLGPLLVFLPWRTPWIRCVLIAAFLSLHIGIDLTMTVGLFAVISMAAWSVFVPSLVWDSRAVRAAGNLLRRMARSSSHVTTPQKKSGRLRNLDAVESATSGLRSFMTDRPGFFANAVCYVLLICAILWNIASLPNAANLLPGWSMRIGELADIRQRWNMFDRPFHFDWRFVYKARLRNGKDTFLLRHGEQYVPDSSRLLEPIFPNDRWHKLHRRFLSENRTRLVKKLASHLAHRWNKQHTSSEQIVFVEVFGCVEAIDLDYPDHADKLQVTFAVVNLGTGEETSVFGKVSQEVLGDGSPFP